MGQSASSRIEIKPFWSPNSIIVSRSADVAVRMQQVQSRVWQRDSRLLSSISLRT